MALFHWAFGLFWILWPVANLQKAPPVYDPPIAAIIAISYVVIVTLLWGPEHWRNIGLPDRVSLILQISISQWWLINNN